VPTDCVVIKCRYAVPLEYVPYPRNPSLFAICIRDRPTMIVKCHSGQEFDSRESRCKFVCKKEGVFAADGCRKFYECVRVNANTFNTVEGECPASTKFDPVSSGCTLGTCGGNSSTGTNTVAVLRRTIDDEQSWGSSS
jgi:hypothetical protein